MVPQPERIAAVIFGLLAVVLLAAGGLAIRDAVAMRFGLLGSVGVILVGSSGTMAWEAVALWTRLLPTISLLTNLEYVRYPVPWLLVWAALMATCGALAVHFTYVKTYDWRVAVLGAVSLIAGAGLTVLTRWTP